MGKVFKYLSKCTRNLCKLQIGAI